MEFGAGWQIEFGKRTLDNLNKVTVSAAIDKEATMLVNSMLGLLVLPREKMIGSLPDVAEHDLAVWGIMAGSIECFGKQRRDRKKVDLAYGPRTLKGVVHSLRNAVCHFGIEPKSDNSKVSGFKFKDWDSNGFKAELERVMNFRQFLRRGT